MKNTPRAHSYTFGDNTIEIPMAAYTTFLNELQRFVLQNSEALQLYRQYLLESPRPSLVNHIDFYQDLLAIEKAKKHTKIEQGDTPLSYFNIYSKYFSGSDPQHLLDIKQDIIMEVRDAMCKMVSATTFKSAIYAVIKDLCFENLTNFTNSDMFQECKVFLRVSEKTSEMLNLSPKERNTTVRLRKFFGEQFYTKDAGRLSFRSQPRHVKSYRLNKRFGERVAIEHNENETASGGESPRSPRGTEWRRSRRLHVFFGDSFLVDEILFSEKIRAPEAEEPINTERSDIPPQPEHVNSHRLSRFFGERVHLDSPQRSEANEERDAEVMDIEDQGSDLGEIPEFIASRFAKNHRIFRFFGERMDPEKEATYKMFADQPANVKSLKLKKIFGSTDVAAAVDRDDLHSYEETDPMKKAKRAHKLHKFFGTKVENGVSVLNMEEEVDHVVPSV